MHTHTHTHENRTIVLRTVQTTALTKGRGQPVEQKLSAVSVVGIVTEMILPSLTVKKAMASMATGGPPTNDDTSRLS